MGIFLGEWSGQDKRLTNHLHLVSMLRKHEATLYSSIHLLDVMLNSGQDNLSLTEIR